MSVRSCLTVSFDYEVEEGVEVELTVSFHEMDDGAIEDIAIYNRRGTPLPGDVQKRLRNEDRFLDAIRSALG